MKEKDLLLVIDPQTAYMPGQPWACPSFGENVKNIQKLLDSEQCMKKYEVLFTQFLAPKEPAGCWKDYNTVNFEINSSEEMNAIVSELVPYLDRFPLVQKSTYTCTTVERIREAATEYKNIVLTGVVAECCVLATAMALMDLGAHVIYLTDGCSGQNAEMEDRVAQVIDALSYVHSAVMTTEEYLNR